MSLGPPGCARLPWDSEFFGVAVARVDGATADALLVADTWCRDEAISVAYLLLPVDDPALVGYAEDLGYRYIDLRVALALERGNGAEPRDRGTGRTDAVIRRCQDSDLDALERIAASAHRDSRFYADARFPRERCDALYATWIRRDCRAPDRTVFVAELDRTPIGYLSLRLHGAHEASIELVGVDAGHRGAGTGRALVDAALEAAFTTVSRATVVTQGRNVAAQRFYQRAGMSNDSIAVWLHKWYDPAAAHDRAGQR